MGGKHWGGGGGGRGLVGVSSRVLKLVCFNHLATPSMKTENHHHHLSLIHLSWSHWSSKAKKIELLFYYPSV